MRVEEFGLAARGFVFGWFGSVRRAAGLLPRRKDRIRTRRIRAVSLFHRASAAEYDFSTPDRMGTNFSAGRSLARAMGALRKSLRIPRLGSLDDGMRIRIPDRSLVHPAYWRRIQSGRCRWRTAAGTSNVDPARTEGRLRLSSKVEARPLDRRPGMDRIRPWCPCRRAVAERWFAKGLEPTIAVGVPRLTKDVLLIAPSFSEGLHPEHTARSKKSKWSRGLFRTKEIASHLLRKLRPGRVVAPAIQHRDASRVACARSGTGETGFGVQRDKFFLRNGSFLKSFSRMPIQRSRSVSWRSTRLWMAPIWRSTGHRGRVIDGIEGVHAALTGQLPNLRCATPSTLAIIFGRVCCTP